jgi:hypothetical protein
MDASQRLQHALSEQCCGSMRLLVSTVCNAAVYEAVLTQCVWSTSSAIQQSGVTMIKTKQKQGGTPAHGCVLQEVEECVCRLCYPRTRGPSCVCERELVAAAHLLSDCYHNHNYYNYFCSLWGYHRGLLIHHVCTLMCIGKQKYYTTTGQLPRPLNAAQGRGTQMQQR